ncbi:hypothetical protein [Planococcus sp. ISL-109]|uniref:hypothetical protein n=1 Tax=Planococcus sp. ISL-109 TaxID=2819166 RepID=UPI001BE9B40D|nr:hypothetical protein [Planococcus sp. ISL-109]MBT2584145.1 hypothetical protein [Planococcus sp. ISL-109]
MVDFYDQKKIILVTFGVILLISAVFVPATVFYPAKVISITPDAEIVGTSFWSLLLGSAGMLLLAIALFIPALIEQPLKSWALSGMIGITGFVAIAFSLGDYYYITQDRTALRTILHSLSTLPLIVGMNLNESKSVLLVRTVPLQSSRSPIISVTGK